MPLRTSIEVAVIALGLWLSGSQAAGSAPWPCPSTPVEACFTHHGRLSSQNGISLKIWLIGTQRVVGLDNDPDPLEALVGIYLDMTSPKHSYVYGDFDICPTERDTPRHLRRVCLAGARKLIVQDVDGVRPPFRILSAWPATGRVEPGNDR